jgi:hypothetical protein
MESNILKRIFFDENNKIRPVVIKGVKKFRGCGDPLNRFKLFVCEGCGGQMYPEYYKGIHGCETKYRMSDKEYSALNPICRVFIIS